MSVINDLWIYHWRFIISEDKARIFALNWCIVIQIYRGLAFSSCTHSTPIFVVCECKSKPEDTYNSIKKLKQVHYKNKIILAEKNLWKLFQCFCKTCEKICQKSYFHQNNLLLSAFFRHEFFNVCLRSHLSYIVKSYFVSDQTKSRSHYLCLLLSRAYNLFDIFYYL